MDLEVVCVQFCPVHKQPSQSMQLVSDMLADLSNCDILLLPEMAFTGYTFQDKADIQELLETPTPGSPTFDWCAEQARRLGAYVVCGYAEGEGDNYFNSMMAVSPTGQLVANHRKKHLYYQARSLSRANSRTDSSMR